MPARFFCLFRLCLLFFFLNPAHAQKTLIVLRILDINEKAIPFAPVTVHNINDSTRTMMSFSDSLGLSTFYLDTATYIVSTKAIGYDINDQVFTVGGLPDTIDLLLLPNNNSLNEVVIKSMKPMIVQDDDKTVINPESLSEASSNGYEVLEKTPGLFVDQDGNVYLSSLTPTLIYINGREMKMSRQDMATILKSLPPNAIEKIELLRTPSAKYDASGSGGIVNVVLKKGIKIGLTGSASAGFQQGKLGNQFVNTELANSNGNTATYVNVSYTRQDNYAQLNTDRELKSDTVLSQTAYSTSPSDLVFVGYGIHHQLGNKLSLGYDGRLSYSSSEGFTDNDNSINVISKDAILASTKSIVGNTNKALLVNQDINAQYKLDTIGSIWETGISYTYSSGDANQTYNTFSLLPSFGGEGDLIMKRHFLTFRSDLTLKLPLKINMEAGVKSSLLMYNSQSNFYTTGNNSKEIDVIRTNTYKYAENINAIYVQGAKGFGGFLLKVGLRAENTDMNGRQFVPGDTSFTIRRTDFFPYVYFSRKIMTIAGFYLRGYLVYRRTISRPGYEQLNPFPRYVDQFLSEVGNPALRPQFTHNYEANVSANEHPLIAIGFNDTRDMFSNVFYQSDSSDAQAFKTFDNIGTNKELYLRGLAAIPPGGRYFAVVGGQFNHNVYKGLYEGRPLSFTGDSWLFFTYHQFKIDKSSQITMQGFLRLKGPLQFYELGTMGSLNLSINRKFFKQKLMVTLSANDVFFSNNNSFAIHQGFVNAHGYRETDSRRFGINFRYHFGLRKREEEEKNLFNIQQDK